MTWRGRTYKLGLKTQPRDALRNQVFTFVRNRCSSSPEYAADVIAAYGEIMLWVQRNPQYFDEAKAKFATEADGWLVAHGMAKGMEVVTNEQPRPEARSRVLLPDVCDRFGVQYYNTFEMLRALGARYNY